MDGSYGLVLVALRNGGGYSDGYENTRHCSSGLNRDLSHSDVRDVGNHTQVTRSDTATSYCTRAASRDSTGTQNALGVYV